MTADEVRATTLRRQFPAREGRGPEAVLELFEWLGPIQSQVPRAPFLTVSSRLPGVGYQVVQDLFAAQRLLKASNIRGTVHTSTCQDFARLDAVARQTRAPALRKYLGLNAPGLNGLEPADVVDEIERFCAQDWRSRDEIVNFARDWLRTRGTTLAPGDFTGNLLWGHSGLIRAPTDGAWERRTDSLRRTARVAVPALAQVATDADPRAALLALVRGHLRAYGPLSRRDLAFFFGTSLGPVDAALTALGDELVRVEGPQGEAWLDVADPITDGVADPGLRLLPEFDGLLVGYSGGGRTRFCSQDQLAEIWARVNGLFSPVVLFQTRLVASWKLVTRGTRTDLEVTMLRGEPVLQPDVVGEQATAVARVLHLELADVRVLADSSSIRKE